MPPGGRPPHPEADITPTPPPSRPSRRGWDERIAPPPASRRSSALFYRLAEFQMRHPWRVLGAAVLLVAVSVALSMRLHVKPGFEHLLPVSRPSVLELNRVKEFTTGVSTIMVVLEGDDTEALRKAADTVVAAVAEIGLPWVGGAESGVHDVLDFVQPRAGLYLSKDQLTKLHADVEERWHWEVNRGTGFLLDEDDYEPPAFDADSLRERFDIDASQADRYPDGYYQDSSGKTVVVLMRSAINVTNFEEASECVDRVRTAIEGVDLEAFHPSIRYGLTGDVVTSVSAFKIINDDLQDVGMVGGLLIIAVVLLYYLRLRTLISMVLTISIGVLCTFGATALLIGHLNLATGFLFTIVAGNGINPGIIYMARYLEARRRGLGGPGAIREAHRETWLPTLTASSAASAAYASLIVTEFRGFRDFGVIGGIGMILCWICTFAFLPSILTVAERLSPLDLSTKGLLGRFRSSTRGGTRFGVPFAALVARAPLAVALMGSALAIGAGYMTVRYIQQDPMEYDLLVMRSDMSERGEEVRLTKLGEDITGFVGIDGMAILVDRPEQVPLLVEALEARRDKAPAGEKPFENVHTLQDFIPADQADKIELLHKIKKRLVRARQRGFVEDEDWKKLEPFLPPEDLKPFTIDELPGGLAHAFSERDGRRGRVVYISPTATETIDDAHYLFRWAESYQHTELSDGSVVLGSGRAVIYADLWAAVIGDVPKAVIASLLMTLFVVAIAFRAGRGAAAVMLALLVGIAWMTGLLAWAEVKVNFLNFIALPITFGIGVDYAVNIMQRYRREGRGGALTAVRETGGAVVLCSMTTTLGYLALVTSVNLAVRSLGVAAVLGEISCLLAAMLTLPAVLVWFDTRWRRRQPLPSSRP